eukprot:1361361-Karenia_brevis.AAC.1
MAALKLITEGDTSLFGISLNMAALRLITSSSRPLLCMSASNGSTHCHGPPPVSYTHLRAHETLSDL